MIGQAMRAYGKAAANRDPKLQEADVFRRVIAVLRHAQDGGTTLDHTRALADNNLLWTMVTTVVADPANALAPDLRARLISLGRAVQREMQREAPDLGFLIEVNENIAAGLEGRR